MKYSDSEIILGSFSYVRLETKAPLTIIVQLAYLFIFYV